MCIRDRDELIPSDALPYVKAWNVELKDPTKETAFDQMVNQKLHTKSANHYPFLGRSAQIVKEDVYKRQLIQFHHT